MENIFVYQVRENFFVCVYLYMSLKVKRLKKGLSHRVHEYCVSPLCVLIWLIIYPSAIFRVRNVGTVYDVRTVGTELQKEQICMGSVNRRCRLPLVTVSWAQ